MCIGGIPPCFVGCPSELWFGGSDDGSPSDDCDAISDTSPALCTLFHLNVSEKEEEGGGGGASQRQIPFSVEGDLPLPRCPEWPRAPVLLAADVMYGDVWNGTSADTEQGQWDLRMLEMRVSVGPARWEVEESFTKASEILKFVVMSTAKMLWYQNGTVGPLTFETKKRQTPG